jgi:serine/threonine protein kinase
MRVPENPLHGIREAPKLLAADPDEDDPRVVRAAQEYLAALEAGHKLNRQEFLARHADIAGPLAECLSALEFVHSVSPRLEERPAEPAPEDSASGLGLATPLGDFRLLREIGRGGMAVVYEAEQLSLGRRIALKVLPFALTLDPRQLQRFKNEARAAAALHHSNIVPIHAVGCERGVHFYAMQYIEGQSLAALIRQLRKLRARCESSLPTTPLPAGLEDSAHPSSFQRAARLGIQAAEALEHAHQLGVVHRDVKPANLLLDVQGQLWVTDFGLAQFQSDAALTVTGDVVGTLRYMSPEQALAKRGLVDHRADIYSLGATLYELLALEPAFDGRDREELLRQIAFEEPRPLRRRNPAVPRDLETIILKAMAKEPERRYATAQELADDLRRFLDDKPIQARRPTLYESAAKWSRRHRVVVAATLVLLAMAALGFGVSTAVIVAEQRKTQRAYEQLEAEEARTRAAYEAEVEQRARADKRFRQAREAVDFLAQTSEEELAGRPELQALRRKMLQTALTYYQDFIEQRGDDPGLQDELARSHMRVAAILDEMGDRTDALAAAERAQQIQEKLAREDPQTAEHQRRLFSIHNHLGWLRDGNPFYLLSQRSVQKELDLTESQTTTIGQLTEKWRDAFRDHWNLNPDKWRARVDDLATQEKALVENLQPKQMTRLQQIALQQRGSDALADADVVEALGLSREQKEKLRGMRHDSRREGRGGPRFGGPRPDGPWRPEWLADRNEEKALALLTDDQKVKWRELTGEPFRGSIRPGYPSGRDGPRGRGPR